MSKRIKKFREKWEDDEWGQDDDTSYKKKKDRRLESRKNKRKEKFSDRWYDEDFNLKRRKS